MSARPWALVTGAGKRLGRAVALELGRNGWGVVAHYNASAAEAQTLVAELEKAGADAVAIGADLSEPAAIDTLAAKAFAASRGALTSLVNAAALFDYDVIANVTPARFQEQMQVNALAPSLLAQRVHARLGEARGGIVNFLDFKLASPYSDHFSYTLSKYALAGATELLARALAPKMRVNAVAPGFILPAPGQSESDYLRLHADTPLDYGPTPEDVAGAVRYLLEAQGVTGQTIYVDGGRRFRAYERDMGFL